VADAVLYEGYLLYPYRRSSGKNRVRWQFGVLAPKPWVEANCLPTTTVAGSSDSWHQRTECLLEARPNAVIHLRLRFLHLQHRSVQRRAGHGDFVEIDAASSGGRRHLTFDEAVEREADITVELAELIAGTCRRAVSFPAAEAVEQLDRDTRIVRTQQPVSATLSLSAQAAASPFPAWRLRLVTESTVTDLPADASRPEALYRALLSTHSLLGVRGGRFLSLLDPPAWATQAARACENLHTFPVLAGEDDTSDVVLSAPIILYDHPAVAPESPGDLFDATEIDEILSLRTMTLTDEEKQEARATDPRAASIIDRVELIPDEVFARLHGAVRSLRPTSAPAPTPRGMRTGTSVPAGTTTVPAGTTVPARTTVPASTSVPLATPSSILAPAAGPTAGQPVASPPPAAGSSPPGPRSAAREPGRPHWWDPDADAAVSPDRESVLIGGVRVAKGARVRLRPRERGGDAHDMFLEGREAVVEGVFLDVDDTRHLAVILADDPGADLHRWYRRYYYFTPDEIQVVSPAEDQTATTPEPGR